MLLLGVDGRGYVGCVLCDRMSVIWPLGVVSWMIYG